MDTVIATGLESLFSLLKKFSHSWIINTIKKRRCFYFFIPIGSEDFLINTKNKNNIMIVKLEDVVSGLLPQKDMETFSHCLDKVYGSNSVTPQTEPYLSIVKNTMRRIIEHYISFNDTKKKIIFISRDFKYFNLVKDSKRKIILLPTDKMIEELLPAVDSNSQLSILKQIFSLSLDRICVTIFFSSILDIDTIIEKQSKLKKVKKS